jgi:hypothetical protein
MSEGGFGINRPKLNVRTLEEIRARKAVFEAAKKKLDDNIALAHAAGLEDTKFAEKVDAVTKAAHRLAWEEATKLATTYADEIAEMVKKELEERESSIRGRIAALSKWGFPVTEEIRKDTEAMVQLLSENKLEQMIKVLDGLKTKLVALEESSLNVIRELVDGSLQWALPERPSTELKNSLSPCQELLDKKEFSKAAECFDKTLTEKVPEIKAKLEVVMESFQDALSLAKGMDIEYTEGEKLAAQAADVNSITAYSIGKRAEKETALLDGRLRKEMEKRIVRMKSVLDKAKEHGVDTGSASHELEVIVDEVQRIPPKEGLSRLSHAESLVEEPVLHVVMEHIEEVRSYLVEARDLGRNVDEIMREMNQARTALRDKDYEGALDGSKQVLERARALLEDVDVTKSELMEFKELLSRLEKGGFDTKDFHTFVKKAEDLISKNDFNGASQVLREGARNAGRQSVQYLREQVESIEKILGIMEERHWSYPEEFNARLEEAHLVLSSSQIPEAAETIADLSVKVEETVNSHVNERVEELKGTLEGLLDEQARTYAQGMISDVKSALEKKGNPKATIDSLHRAEQEINVTLASEISRLIIEIEESLKNLEKMGILTEDFTRGAAQVREIFDVGDFVRAVRSAQDLSVSIGQKAASRVEEVLSEAKLALVEVSRTVSEPQSVKDLLEQARADLQNGRYLEAFETAQKSKDTAFQIRTTAQKIVDKISHIVNQLSVLRKKGASVEDLRLLTSKIADVRASYQTLAFEAAETVITEIQTLMDNFSFKIDGKALAEKLRGMLEGSISVDLPNSEWQERLDVASKDLDGKNPQGAAKSLESLAKEVMEKMRPVLEEALKKLGDEVRAARQEGLDTKEVSWLLSEAVAKMKEEYPVGVPQAIVQIRKQFFQSRGFQEAAQKALELAKEAINQAEMMRLDMSHVKDRVAEIEKGFSTSDFGGALELAQKVRDEAEESMRNHLNSVLSSLQGVIVRAKREGTLTMVAENYLVKARSLVGQANPMEVLQLVSQAENELEKVELQHSIAQSSVTVLEDRANNSKEDGLVCNDGVNGLKDAKAAFERGDYSQVLETVLKANDAFQLAENLHRKAKESCQKVTPMIESMKGLGLDTTDAESKLRSAQGDEVLGKYSESDATARSLWEEARTAVVDAVAKRFEEVNSVIALFPQGDPIGDELKHILESTHEARSHENWRVVVAGTNDAIDKSKLAIKELQDRQRSRLKPILKPLTDEEKATLDGLERGIDAFLAEGKLPMAGKTWTTLKERTDHVISTHLDADMARLGKDAMMAERLGADGSPVIEKISEARALQQAGKLDTATSRIVDAARILDQAIAGRLPDRLADLRKNIMWAKDRYNVAVSSLEESARTVESLRSSGDMVSAAHSFIETDEELARRKGWQKELVNLHYLIDTLIDKAVDMKKSTSHASELLEESIRQKAAGQYEKALQAAGTAVAELKLMIELAEKGGSPKPDEEKGSREKKPSEKPREDAGDRSKDSEKPEEKPEPDTEGSEEKPKDESSEKPKDESGDKPREPEDRPKEDPSDKPAEGSEDKPKEEGSD